MNRIYPPSYVCAVDLMKFPEVMTTWQIYLVDLSKNWKTLIKFVSRHISSLLRQKIAEFHVFFRELFYFLFSSPLLISVQKPIRGKSTCNYYYYWVQLATVETILSPTTNLGDCCFNFCLLQKHQDLWDQHWIRVDQSRDNRWIILKSHVFDIMS